MSNSLGILIAEDEENTIIYQTYKRMGFDVVGHQMPSDALDCVRERRGSLDVGIIDLWMNWPGQGKLDKEAGLVLLKKIKSEIDPDLGVVVLTGHGSEPEEDCRKAGASAFILKATTETWDLLDVAVAKAAIESLQKRLTTLSGRPANLSENAFRDQLEERMAQAKAFAQKLNIPT